MAKTRRIFLSDIHMSSAELYQRKKLSTWYLPEKHQARLLGFLNGYVLAGKEEIKDVILLGDIFNTWVCPANMRPPTYASIIKSNGDVIAAFRRIIRSGINIFYVNGNHDFDLRPDEIQARIKGIRPVKYYRSGRIHAEHGHRHDIYNRPDFISDPAFGRPIGYFISRLTATAGAKGPTLLDLPAYLDDLLEAAATSQTIFASIVEAMAERAGMQDSDTITMPEGRKLTVAEVKQRYERLSTVYSISELINDLYERRYLHASADRLCARHNFNTVIFGHTHNALVDKDWFLVEDRIYANTGSWCKEKAYCVEIDKSPAPEVPITVCAMQIGDEGAIKNRTCEQLG